MCLIKTNSFRAEKFPETKKSNLILTSIGINGGFFIAIKRCSPHSHFVYCINFSTFLKINLSETLHLKSYSRISTETDFKNYAKIPKCPILFTI